MQWKLSVSQFVGLPRFDYGRSAAECTADPSQCLPDRYKYCWQWMQCWYWSTYKQVRFVLYVCTPVCTLYFIIYSVWHEHKETSNCFLSKLIFVPGEGTTRMRSYIECFWKLRYSSLLLTAKYWSRMQNTQSWEVFYIRVFCSSCSSAMLSNLNMQQKEKHICCFFPVQSVCLVDWSLRSMFGIGPCSLESIISKTLKWLCSIPSLLIQGTISRYTNPSL